MSKPPQIIGIAGTFASGQDTLAKYLQDEYDYLMFSTSDAVRKVSQERHGSIERPYLHESGKFLRETKGAGATIEMGLDEFRKSGKPGVVLPGIRTMGELKTVVKNGGVMLFVDADPEIRYQRMTSRARDSEAKISHEEFEVREAKEYHAGESDTDFNRRDIYAYCQEQDMVINNDTGLEDYLNAAKAKLGLA